jgi:hypothetical protein
MKAPDGIPVDFLRSEQVGSGDHVQDAQGRVWFVVGLPWEQILPGMPARCVKLRCGASCMLMTTTAFNASQFRRT